MPTVRTRILTIVLLLTLAAGPLPSAIASQAQGSAVLQDGTPVRLRINRNLSSKFDKVGATVDFEVLDEIRVRGLVVIEKGGFALGTITEAKPARRLGRGGKLDLVLDKVRLVSGQTAALRAAKETDGGGRVASMTAGLVATGILFFPAAPLLLFMKGKDIEIPKGTELTAYVNGNLTLDLASFPGAQLEPPQSDIVFLTSPRQVQPSPPTQPKVAVDSPRPTAPSQTGDTISVGALPGDTISVGVLPPMPSTPPEKLAQSATWTTRAADGVGYRMSVTVGNHNEAPMRAVATIVLREATGGALYSTRVDFLVPPNATHEEKGTGTVPNEVANSADHWSIDVTWDRESLPSPTSPTPTTSDGRTFLIKDARAGAVRLGDAGDLISPVPIYRPDPEYPEYARRAGVGGLVVIEAVVMTDGTVADPKILRGVTLGDLNRLALEAVAKWTYKPGSKDGQSVPFIITVTVVYQD
jgi:TonB family protein